MHLYSTLWEKKYKYMQPFNVTVTSKRTEFWKVFIFYQGTAEMADTVDQLSSLYM